MAVYNINLLSYIFVSLKSRVTLQGYVLLGAVTKKNGIFFFCLASMRLSDALACVSTLLYLYIYHHPSFGFDHAAFLLQRKCPFLNIPSWIKYVRQMFLSCNILSSQFLDTRKGTFLRGQIICYSGNSILKYFWEVLKIWNGHF